MATGNVASNALTVDPLPRQMTEQEFLEWTANEDIRAEWVDGEAFELMPPDDRHQDITGFLIVLLRMFALRLGIGVIRNAPFEMRLPTRPSYREPDLLFVAAERAGRIDGKRLIGAADLAVEIVGDDSSTRDQRDKFNEYAGAGVQEYWIIDPRPGRAIFRAFALTNAGEYQPIEADETGRIHSQVMSGLWIEPRWLEADPLPDPFNLLAEIAPDQFANFKSGN